MQRPTTVGALRAAGTKILPVKDEIRRNLIARLRDRKPLFPGIIGYEQTVIPDLINALLARHDLLLLGLRGQAKSRLVRHLPSLLDEHIPIIKGSELNDDPFRPVSKAAVDLVRQYGDEVEIEWIHRDQRFSEKLATPDVTIADLIGDIDPIKAATQRLHYAHEGAIHYGIIPRSNRGIFAINELPDLQPRIQVGLFNIMEEKDIQIRGFNVRIPLDLLLVFTANPEDYTNRGNLITPLKDRIDAQILTHYPHTLEDGITITQQEAWVRRGGPEVHIPRLFREIVEQIAFEARASEYVDQKSGVSARLTIASMENLVSNAERRAIMTGEAVAVPRIVDLHHALPGMTGKMELVFEGEQEGAVKVSKALIGKAIRTIFTKYFPDPLQKQPRERTERPERVARDQVYAPVVGWFEKGNHVEVTDEASSADFLKELRRIDGLEAITKKHLADLDANELASAMEFVLEALHQCSKIAKDEADRRTSYTDMVGSIFSPNSEPDEDP
ncbi:MAG: magnesium chelatase [Bacteroidetes bacterium]|jgi:magnesium chelatase subunit I|nr:magnesium chelatase [Bacteroidota bacterium]